MLNEQFFNGLFAVYAVLFVLTIVCGICFQHRLKKKHPEVWEQIGWKYFGNSRSSSFQQLKWLFQRKFRKLGDSRLSLYGELTRLGCCGVIFLLLATLGLMLFGQYQNGVWDRPPSGHAPNATGVIMLSLFAGLILSFWLFLDHLQNKHSDQWTELGRPRFFDNNPIRFTKVQYLFLTGRFWKLNDKAIKTYTVVGALCWVCLLAIIVLIELGRLHT